MSHLSSPECVPYKTLTLTLTSQENPNQAKTYSKPKTPSKNSPHSLAILPLKVSQISLRIKPSDWNQLKNEFVSLFGGDNISVTNGVVSRIDVTLYEHAKTELLAIQIDAAINPGNSGGPAIMGDKVAGVAFQTLIGGKNIGYIVPMPIGKHFIAGVEERGKHVGFCSLGFSCQHTQNVQLRRHFRMRPEMTGVLVRDISPLSDAHRVLKKHDIILTFDGVPIANDGTVPFGYRQRIQFEHVVSMKKPNETTQVRVLRDGVVRELRITFHPLEEDSSPVRHFDKLPSYYIFAGLVFIPLTEPYIQECREEWHNTSRSLCGSALEELTRKYSGEIVILSEVIMDDINAGYEQLSRLRIVVNGVKIHNLKHLCKLVEGCKKDTLRFDLDYHKVLVLDYHLARGTTDRILECHMIPSAMSADLINDPIVDTEASCARMLKLM
ncbi:protease Do-like 10, mitochondrial [Tasmannia lanceolata]|uniref:protease Do-like 10, mitochondrial n=1 Tax=Tasmannia lanceolata TaxID=3420 RepID=UPI00406342C9